MKAKFSSILFIFLIICIHIVAQPPDTPGGGTAVPLDGGLLLGLLAGGSALSAYLFKRKKKEE